MPDSNEHTFSDPTFIGKPVEADWMDENVVVMRAKKAQPDDPGALVDRCGNAFIPDLTTAYWASNDTLVGFCGCGSPLRLVELVAAYLSCLEDKSLSHREREDRCGGPDMYLVMAYIADAKRWTEHGSSVFGAWLTDLGKQTLTGLRAMLSAQPKPPEGGK